MAGRLILKHESYAMPGNVERSYIEEVTYLAEENVSATLAHWVEKSKKSTESGGSGFVKVVGAKEDPNGKALTAETYLVNVNEVQNVFEY